jgi:hypothetical protein
MAIEYRLTLAGATPISEIAARAFPDPADRPEGTPSLLAADLDLRFGFQVTVYADENGYVEAESDEEMWIWEPEEFASMTFRMDKDAEPVSALTAMLAAVRRVLDTGTEDASLDLNGSWLLLTRTGGVTMKHKLADWWAVYNLS